MADGQANSGDGSGRTVEELSEELIGMAAHLAAATQRWLAVLGEFDAREGWAGYGVRSCAHWLSWQCGIDLGAARQKVRVARALPALPRLDTAFARGELSYSMVRALTRVATPANEADLLDLARHATVSQVERLVRALRRATQAELLDDARHQHETRHLHTRTDDDGSLVLTARLPADAGALLETALRAALAHVSAEPPDSYGVPPDGYAARLADALTLVAKHYLTGGQPAGETVHVVVTAEADALTTDDGHCHLPDGTALAAETARRLSCDSLITPPTVAADGGALNVGRRTRRVPPRLRLALDPRDRGCRFPSCTQQTGTDAHHITHWAHGGPTTLDNLLLLCRHHHTLIHEGGYTIDHHHIFHHPTGRAIPHAPPLGPGHPDHTTIPDITPDALRSRWQGDHLDLNHTLTNLLTTTA